MEIFGVENGLSQGMIYDLLQTRDGFLWIATKDGLNRYDGYHFKVFNHDAFNPNSISGSTVTSLFEDSKGRLWAGTENDGLNLYDRASRRFFSLENTDKTPNTLTDNGILCLAETADGAIWIGTGHGLNRLQFKDPLPESIPANYRLSDHVTITQFFFEKDQIGDGPDHFFRLFISSKKELWAFTKKNAYLISKDGKKVVKTPTGLDAGIKFMVESKQGKCWVNTYYMLYYGAFGDFQPAFPEKQDVKPPRATCMNKQGECWIASSKNLYRIPAMGTPQDITWVTDLALPSNAGVTTMMFDRSGNLWLGLNGYGLLKFKPDAIQRFQHSLQKKSVKRIFEDSRGNLHWQDYATDLRTGEPISPDLRALFSTWEPLFLMEARNKKFWFLAAPLKGASPPLLLKTDPATGLRKEYAVPIEVAEFSRIFEDREGKIWVTGNKGKLAKLDPTDGHFQVIDYSDVIGTDSKTIAFIEDNSGRFWLGTPHGLAAGTPANGTVKFSLFKNNPSDIRTLSNDHVLSLLSDPRQPDRYLWVGTRGGGLNLLDLTSGKFRHFDDRNGLPNNVVYGILNDKDNNLWLSTNRGLCKFSIADMAVGEPVTVNFTTADGLVNNEFNTDSYCKRADGQLLFGGISGLTAFYPKDLTLSTFRPPVYFTSIKINGKEVNAGESGSPLTQPIELARQLTLRHGQNLVSFEFAALDFSAPEQNLYEYQMTGLENSWVKINTNHEVTFSNLSPGKYHFKVRGSNSSGVFGEATAEIKLVVLPPWWRSWWAYGVYGCIIFGLGLGVYFMKINRLKLENQLHNEQREAARLAEMDHFKTNFFTNITHEFRTPLTVILGVAEQIETKAGEEVKSKTKLIKRNGQGLLRLINQVLDLAKMENKALKANYINGDVLAYLRYACESFSSLAAQRGIALTVECDPLAGDKLWMDFDPEKLLQITSNLLSNALKHTPAGGSVQVFISREATHLHLAVEDTGTGIAPKDLPRIFDRFFQTEEGIKMGGAGIGLAFTRELVKLMEGDITVESTVGKGTVFKVMLPIVSRAPSGAITTIETEKPYFGGIDNKAPQPAATPKNGHRPRLLLIEDNFDVAEYIAGCLQDNYQLAFARNGQEGLDKALEWLPDLVISDVMMPEKDGFEVCAFLKNDLRTSHIPIILLTARADAESRLQGLRRGADAYLAKPFNPSELLAHLDNLYEVRRKIQAHYSSPPAIPTLAIPAETSTADTVDLDEAFMNKMIAYIETHIDDADLTLDDLCKRAGMGRTHLTHKISLLTGMTPMQYLRMLRLHRAKAMLADANLSIADVAYSNGFKDPKHFSRLFSDAFGMPPSAYRQD